jgi:hypothetical protein
VSGISHPSGDTIILETLDNEYYFEIPRTWEIEDGANWLSVFNHIVTGLTPETTYEWSVRSKVSEGVGLFPGGYANAPLYSEPILLTFDTMSVPPEQVTGLVATSTDTDLTLSFNADPYPDAYRIKVTNSAGTIIAYQQTYLASELTNHTIVIGRAQFTGVYPDREELKVNIYAQKNGAESPASATITTILKCPAPSNLRVALKNINGSYARIAVEWTTDPNYAWGSSYENVLIATPTTGSPITKIIPTWDWSGYDFTNLTLNMEYTFRVHTRAVGYPVSTSASSNEIVAMVASAAGAVTTSTQTSATPTTINVSWPAAANAVSYKIYAYGTLNYTSESFWYDWTAHSVIDGTTATITLASSEVYGGFSQVNGVYALHTGMTYVTAAQFSNKIRIDSINADGAVTRGSDKAYYLAPSSNNMTVSNNQAWAYKLKLLLSTTPSNYNTIGSFTFALTGHNVKTLTAVSSSNITQGTYYEPSVSVPADTPGEEYAMQVIVSMAGNPYSSAPYQFPAYTSPLDSHIVASNITATSVDLTWEPTPGADTYTLTFNRISGTGAYPSQPAFNATSANITGLGPNTTYEVYIRPSGVDPYRSYVAPDGLSGWKRYQFSTPAA